MTANPESGPSTDRLGQLEALVEELLKDEPTEPVMKKK